jgi:hypothetical protein
VSYALAQLSHHWALARTLPPKLRHWKGILGCSARYLVWSIGLRLGRRGGTAG